MSAVRLAAERATAVVTDIQDEAGHEVVEDDVPRAGGWRRVVEHVLAEGAGSTSSSTMRASARSPRSRRRRSRATSHHRGRPDGRLPRHAGVRGSAEGVGPGAVVNVSSIFGTSGGFGTSPAYHAAKGAVRTLTKNVALQWWATQGVRVNSIHPGFIRTPILDEAKARRSGTR